MEFVGITNRMDSVHMKLPDEKIKRFGQKPQQPKDSARMLSHLLGKMNAAAQVIPPAPLFYPSLTDDLDRSLEQGRPGLRDGDLVTGIQRGTVVVGQPHDPVECGEERYRPSDRIRCFTDMLEGSMLTTQDRWTLVQTRGLDAHKLPGAVSSYFEDFCQRTGQEYQFF